MRRSGSAKPVGLLSTAICMAGMAFFTVGAYAGPILVNYQVDDSFTGVGALVNANNFTSITGSQGDTLTLTYAPEEPGAAVVVPTNTAFGTLYLDINALPASGTETYSLSGVTLTQELIDLATGLGVTETGAFSGILTISGSGDSSSGLITWSAAGAVQNVASPSIVFFTTDATDPIGTKLDGVGGTPALTQPATTVNGTVNASPVPEPATLGLTGGVLLAFGGFFRKRLSSRKIS
jgi:hypothetical protein